MIKKLVVLLLSVSPVFVCGDTLFRDYEAYFLSLKNNLFSPQSASQKMSIGYDDKGDAQYFWQDKDQKLILEIQGKTIFLNQKKIRKISVFPKEHLVANALGLQPLVYTNKNYLCLEGTANSASGKAARLKTVYLINLQTREMSVLPSLFASCLGIRNVDNTVTFFQAEYGDGDHENNDETDKPSGVTFKEFQLKERNFLKTGNQYRVRFADPENVYEFYSSDQGKIF